MKTAIAIFVLSALLIAPIACAVTVCPEIEKHDCCPKSKSFAACPFDILTAAKAALPALPVAILERIAVLIEPFTPDAFEPAAADDRDLHLQNRILRI